MDKRMPLHSVARLGGGILILAAFIMVAGAAVPFFAPSLRDAPWTDDPAVAVVAIAGNPGAYAMAHTLFIAASLLTALGLVPVSLGFQGGGRAWAMMAVVAFACGAVIETINRTINIEVFTWGALTGVDVRSFAIESTMRFQAGLSHAHFVLAYLALALFGVALLRQPNLGGLGWLFAAGSVLGLVLQATGFHIPAFVFIGTGALGIVTWVPGIASAATP